MPEPQPIPYPDRGLDTESAYSNQPERTSRDRLNVRPRDYRAGGLSRPARRPGLTRYSTSQLGDPSPINALSAVMFTQNVGTSSIVSVAATDDFDNRGSDTSVGDLGDWDADAGGSDYKVFEESTARMEYDSTNQYAWKCSWDQAYASSGTGVFVDDSEESVVDNRQDGDETSSGAARIAVCIFDPTGTGVYPTDNYSLKLGFTMKSSFSESGLASMLGLVVHAKTSSPENDGAFWFNIGFRKTTSLFSDRMIVGMNAGWNTENDTDDGDLSAMRGVDNSVVASEELPNHIPENGIEETDPETTRAYQLTNQVTISAGSSHTLELRKLGTRVEIYFDDVRYLVFPDITVKGIDATASPTDTTNTGYGFMLNSVGTVANGAEMTSPAVASIDSFVVSEVENSGISTPTKVVAVSDRSVYIGDDADGISLATGGSTLTADNPDVQIVRGLGPTAGGSAFYAYILDGKAYNRVNLANSVASTWAADGNLPVGSVTGATTCRYGFVHQGAIHLYGNDENPDNWWRSRRFDADDWDTTSTTNLSRVSVSGDTTDVGPLPEPISGAFPWVNNVAVFGSLTKIYGLVGIPTPISGSFELLSENFGMCCAFAGTADDRGSFYGVDYRGLWVLAPGQRQPVSLSKGRIDSFFNSIDHTTHTVRLLWSRAHDGLHVFVTPNSSSVSEAPKHLWWDRRTNVFELDRFPLTQGPMSVAYLTEAGGSERVLMGGFDGRVRQMIDSASDDDGTSVEAYVDMGPLVYDFSRKAHVRSCDMVLGQNTERVKFSMFASPTAEETYTASTAISRTYEGGGLKGRWEPERGDGAIRFRIESVAGSYWSVESLAAEVEGTDEMVGRS